MRDHSKDHAAAVATPGDTLTVLPKHHFAGGHLSLLDWIDSLYIQFDVVFIGLGELVGAFVEWVLLRYSSGQYASEEMNKAQGAFTILCFFLSGPAWTRTRDLFLIREAL